MLRKQSHQRAFVILSGLFFLGSIVSSAIPIYSNVFQGSNPSALQTPEDDSLGGRERGYEIVLQREPSNQTALEGLANTRLDMNNPKAAIAPLETLVNLHPDRVDYQALLKEAKERAAEK